MQTISTTYSRFPLKGRTRSGNTPWVALPISRLKYSTLHMHETSTIGDFSDTLTPFCTLLTIELWKR